MAAPSPTLAHVATQPAGGRWPPTNDQRPRRGLWGEPLAVGLHRAVAGELAAIGLYEAGMDALGGQLS